MSYRVTATFQDVSGARRAADELVGQGFPTEQISVVAREEHRESFGVAGYGDIIDRNAGRGAVAGGVLGAIVGGIVALVSLGIPGGIIVAGPIAAAVGGLAAGAAGGTLLGALIGTGIPEKEAREYARQVEQGGILLAVDTTNATEAHQARETMTRCGSSSRPHIEPPEAVPT